MLNPPTSYYPSSYSHIRFVLYTHFGAHSVCEAFKSHFPGICICIQSSERVSRFSDRFATQSSYGNGSLHQTSTRPLSAMIASTSASLILGLNLTSKGSGCVFIVSVNANTSMGADGSSEIRNAQRWSAVFMNTVLKCSRLRKRQMKVRRGMDIPVCYVLTRTSTEYIGSSVGSNVRLALQPTVSRNRTGRP